MMRFAASRSSTLVRSKPDIEIDSKDNFRVAPGLGVRVAIPMLGPAPLAFDFAVPGRKGRHRRRTYV